VSLPSTPILEELFIELKDQIARNTKKIRHFLSEGILEEDTPTTAGSDGVMGKVKSHTVMLNCTRIQGGK
jgi:hypothetical protein